MIYRNRRHAGIILAQELMRREFERPIVLALPRGGVPVGYEVAMALNAPLDVFIVRKIGVPGQEELAMGAVASGGIRVINEEVVRGLGIPMWMLDRVSEQEEKEILRRQELYGVGKRSRDLSDRSVIIVDDGLATGSTMKAAIRAISSQNPGELIVAVPVGAKQTCIELEDEADEVVCAATPEQFHGVGQWYQDFTQTSDGEVKRLLEEASMRDAA